MPMNHVQRLAIAIFAGLHLLAAGAAGAQPLSGVPFRELRTQIDGLSARVTLLEATQPDAGACTPILSLPATITQPGVYCFRAHHTFANSSGVAIQIDADNVVLDLNGWTLSAGAANQATGIASSNRRNVTVRNGTIARFRTGVSLLGNNHVAERLRVDEATEGGIGVLGDSNIIRNNHVIAVHRTEGLAWGIYVDGRRNVISNNDVTDITTPDGPGVGIVLSNFSGTGEDFLAVGNRITGAGEGIRFEHGATGKYRDNLTSGVDVPFVGGTDAGNNG